MNQSLVYTIQEVTSYIRWGGNLILRSHAQVKIEESFFNTTACVLASTSPFVVAFITLMVAKQLLPPTVFFSVGSLLVPQVVTSFAVPLLGLLILVKTKWKAEALVQLPVVEG